MPESAFNVLIAVVAIVIFVGRAVYEAKKKTSKPPPKVKIPVHFEDDEEPKYFNGKAPAVVSKTVKKPSPKQKKPAASKQQPTPPRQELFPDAPSANMPLPANKTASEKSFPNNLDHLSPMKQAVVLAEILGTPKGLL